MATVCRRSPPRLASFDGARLCSAKSRVNRQNFRYPQLQSAIEENTDRTKGRENAMTDGTERLADTTAEIVSAYVTHNQVAASDLPTVIRTVAGILAALGQEPQAAVPSKREPAVAVRRSVRPDRLLCLVCGKPQKLLKRHLAVAHELTPTQYRETFGLKPSYPMVAPSYAQQRGELALRIGLGRPKKPTRRRRRKAAGAEAPSATQ
jgi:predicted transcriptional regulator